ncbi:hypothetical protein VH86_05930 [Pantoea sp. BL1]|nr:hypothetical protein VH86_05930 [Pantoea sp. BL1]
MTFKTVAAGYHGILTTFSAADCQPLYGPSLLLSFSACGKKGHDSGGQSASAAARAIRSAEAFTLGQEPGAWMQLAVRLGQDGLTRTVRQHDVKADGTASAARGRPGSSRGAQASTPAFVPKQKSCHFNSDSLCI